jgi:MoxR-like ATPase
MFRAWSGYPDPEEEVEVLRRIDLLEEPAVQAVTTPEEVLAVVEQVRGVHVSEEVRRYVVSVVSRLRHDPDVSWGPSPRAAIALYKGGRALAYVDGRDYVLPDDVKRLAGAALVHRIHVKSEAEMDGVTPETIVARALEEVAVPKPVA